MEKIDSIVEMLFSTDKGDQDLALDIVKNDEELKSKFNDVIDLILKNPETIPFTEKEIWVVKINGKMIPLGKNKGAFTNPTNAKRQLATKCSELIGTGQKVTAWIDSHSIEVAVTDPRLTQHPIKAYDSKTGKVEIVPCRLLLYQRFNSGLVMRNYLIKSGIATVERII